MVIKENKIPARLVPLLPEIDAGCGLALRSEKKFYKEVENIFKSNNLSYEDRYILVYEDKIRKVKVKKYDLLWQRSYDNR